MPPPAETGSRAPPPDRPIPAPGERSPTWEMEASRAGRASGHGRASGALGPADEAGMAQMGGCYSRQALDASRPHRIFCPRAKHLGSKADRAMSRVMSIGAVTWD